jgi:hypothetical protein
LKTASRYLFTLLIVLPNFLYAQYSPARKGLINLKNYNFQTNGPATLSGEWEFYMSELVPPGRFNSNSEQTQDFIDFPSTWNDLSKSLEPGNGFATYRVRAIVDSSKTFTFELPHFYSSYRMWVNRQLIAHNGIVGMNRQSSEPQWLPQTIAYKAQRDTLDIVIQASNFFHANGGVREPILLDDGDQLIFKHDLAVNATLTLAITLGVCGVVFLFIYLFIKNEISTLFFAGLSLTWGLRAIFSNLYVLTQYIPEFPWEISVKIEYMTLYLAMVWAILFISSLFKNEVNNLFKYVMVICNLFFTIITVIFDATLYTQFLPVYLSVSAVLILYIVYVLIRAFVYERDGAVLVISCLFLGVVIFSYDIIAYEGFATFNPIIINTGYFLMFVLLGLSMVYKLGFLKKSSGHHNVLTFEDLYGTNRDVKR